MEPKASGGRFALALVLFCIAVLIAILLIITALLIVLTQAFGSMTAAALTIGVFFALVAIVIYAIAIRKPLEEIRAQAETVYEVARAARSGYDWLIGKVAVVLGLRGEVARQSPHPAPREERKSA